MTDVDLEEIELVGGEQYPANESVKLNGPPGTGKTTQCTLRVMRLLDEHGYELSDVAWSTYRTSLARETLERLAEAGVIPEGQLNDPTKGATRYIATMHACANRLVDGLGDVAGYGDKKQFAESRGLTYEKQSAWHEPAGRTLFDIFRYAANNLLDVHKPEELEQIPTYDDEFRDKYPGNIARAWDAWQDYKAQEGLYDFWEQLAEPLRQDITLPHDVVVIDEYHDATPLMARLAEAWIEQAEVAIVAGDPLQVVNTYTGARPEFFERVDLPEVLLDTTHRVPEESWAVATSILENAHEAPPVERTTSGSFHVGESPRFAYSGGEWNAPDPETRLSPGWFIDEFGTDTMFLTRTQRQASGIAAALEEAGILYRVQGSMNAGGWGGGDEMSERAAIYNALQKLDGVLPKSETAGYGLDRYHDADRKTPSDVALRAREAAALLDHAHYSDLAETRSDVTKKANAIDEEGVVVYAEDLEPFVEETFWRRYTLGAGSVGHLNSSSQARKGSKLDLSKRGVRVLKAALKRNDNPVGGNIETKVHTIHASKGSEARSVVVYDGITNRIQEAMADDEEERKNEYRTWYVALTRAAANTVVLRDAFEWTIPFLPDGKRDSEPSLRETAQAAHEAGVNVQ